MTYLIKEKQTNRQGGWITFLRMTAPALLIFATAFSVLAMVPSKAEAQSSSQSQTYINGVQNSDNRYITNVGTTALTAGPYCVGTQILGRLLVGTISTAINFIIKNTLGEILGNIEDNPNSVPAHEDGEALRLQNTEMNARIGQFGPYGLPENVSWDSVAYCIVNTILEYIVNSTIQWANTGFNGNPAFLQNPKQFFSELADYEAGKFIQELAYNETGVNVCEPFRVEIATALSESYANQYNYGYYGACSLSDIQQRGIMSGDYSMNNMSDWLYLTQTNNNMYGSYMQAGDFMQQRILSRDNVARFELSTNSGFLNYKKCENPEDESTCRTYTPGVIIQESLSKTLNLPKDRLVKAEKFDQLVDALVNNLIKIALNKAMEEMQDN